MSLKNNLKATIPSILFYCAFFGRLIYVGGMKYLGMVELVGFLVFVFPGLSMHSIYFFMDLNKSLKLDSRELFIKQWKKSNVIKWSKITDVEIHRSTFFLRFDNLYENYFFYRIRYEGGSAMVSSLIVPDKSLFGGKKVKLINRWFAIPFPD